MSRRFVSLWLPVLLYTALLFGLSSVAHPPELPGAGIPNFDKYLHATLYGGLSALFVRARAGGWGRPITLATVLAAILFAAAYGASDELHQSFVPPREMDALDLLADTIGATLAAGALYAGIIPIRRE